MNNQYVFGAIPSPLDSNDFHIAKFVQIEREFPEKFIWDVGQRIITQGSVGACVAASVTLIKEIQEKYERGVYENYSAQFIYSNRSKTDYQGEGMYPRQALKRLQDFGVPPENALPGLNHYGNFGSDKLTPWQYKSAEPQKIGAYARLYTPDEIKAALLDFGPVTFCINVWDKSFTNAGRMGYLTKPTADEKIWACHEMTIIGWQNDGFVDQNSYGTKWGLNGRCIMPFNYPLIEAWSVTDIHPYGVYVVSIDNESGERINEYLHKSQDSKVMIKAKQFNGYRLSGRETRKLYMQRLPHKLAVFFYYEKM